MGKGWATAGLVNEEGVQRELISMDDYKNKNKEIYSSVWNRSHGGRRGLDLVISDRLIQARVSATQELILGQHFMFMYLST
jgi:hypothetical protein